MLTTEQETYLAVKVTQKLKQCAQDGDHRLADRVMRAHYLLLRGAYEVQEPKAREVVYGFTGLFDYGGGCDAVATVDPGDRSIHHCTCDAWKLGDHAIPSGCKHVLAVRMHLCALRHAA